jgi:hypothetical protein
VEVSRMTEADVYQFIAQNKLGVLGRSLIVARLNLRS